jgi:predicted phage tail protein
MQDALDAAVRSLNNGSSTNGSTAEAPSRSAETIGAVMAILPKLLRGNEAGEELVEKLDNLQKGDIAALKEQVTILRKQCHRLIKTQEIVMTQLAEIDQRQSVMIDAILELRDQLARVLIVEETPEPEGARMEARRPVTDLGQGRGEPQSGPRKRPPDSAAKYTTRARP